MLTWLMEAPLTILFTGLAVEVLLFSAFYNSGQKHLLWAMLAVLLVTAGLLTAERLIVTPGEEVRTQLDAILAGVERDDAPFVLDQVYSNAPRTKDAIRRAMSNMKISEISIKSSYTVTFDNKINPPEAETRFNATAKGESKSGTLSRDGAVYLVMRFRKEQGRWKLSEVVPYPPQASQTNQKIEPYEF